MTWDELVEKLEKLARHPSDAPSFYNHEHGDAEIGVDGYMNAAQCRLLAEYLEQS